jgi:hypothetical protein
MNKLYKFGYTHEVKAETRFTEQYHKQNNFRGVSLGRDYNVKILWSAWVPEARAIELERLFANLNPKEFWTDTEYNGITECRVFSEKRYRENIKLWYKLYPSRSTKRAEGLQHVYFAELTRKELEAQK